jgi:thioredoxin 2
MASPSEIELIRCGSCGATNRVPRDPGHSGKQPVCGRCKRPLTSKTGPVTVTDATFASEVERSALPVLLDMWATWCGPCRMVAPILEEIAAEMAGRIKVGKLNVDENPVISSRFNVQSIPTLLMFKNGAEVGRIVGALPKHEILRRMEHLA